MSGPSLPQGAQVDWANYRPWIVLIYSGLIFSLITSGVVIIYQFLAENFSEYDLIVLMLIVFSFLGILLVLGNYVLKTKPREFDAAKTFYGTQVINKWIMWWWSTLISVFSVLIVIFLGISDIGIYDAIMCILLGSFCATHLSDYVWAKFSGSRSSRVNK